VLHTLYPWLLAAILMLFVWQTVAARRNAPPPPSPPDKSAELVCDTVTKELRLPDLPEASGLAVSARNPGVLWSINDSAGEDVLALDATARTIGRIQVAGVHVNNWEDVSVSPCETGSCLYIADTGNGGGTQRNDVVVYRVPEPQATDQRTAPAVLFNAAYPADEDHEAEAVFVAQGQLYLITKGHPSLVYRFPRRMPAGTLETLERVGTVPTERFLSGTISRQTRITDAETSPNGMWVAMRTNRAMLLYRTADIVAGRFEMFWYLELSFLNEPQGEGIALSNDGDVFLASEGGGRGAAGTFAHLKCQLPS
jgi:hypothetical protein